MASTAASTAASTTAAGHLSNIEVHYGDDANSEPAGSIPVVDANGGDINKGFRGKYVWLVPRYNTGSPSAINNIRIIIQDQADAKHKDLAAGAGGKYRYLRLETGTSGRITQVKLLRRKEIVSYDTVKSLGFNEYSGDINSGRGGDFLYLVWKNR